MNNSIRLNSVPSSIFTVSEKADSSAKKERNDLVSVGRLLAYEAAGKLAMLRSNSDFKPTIDATTYKTTNENYSQKLFMYAAKIAANALGEDAPEDYASFIRMQSYYLKNETFLRVLSGISRDVITPLLPYTTSNVLGELAQVVTVPMGRTYEVTVKSNDVFVFQDSSWGATRSVPKNYLYDDTITINPTPTTAAVKIKWYQLIGNADGGADFGRFYNALTAGLSNKILALWNGTMTSISSSAKYVPQYLRFSSYTTANWVSAAKAVSMANHVSRDRLMAFGDFAAISKLLPSSTAQDAALTMLLGQEYMSKGYIGVMSGVPVTEINNAFVAGQTNLASPTSLLSTSTIYMAARGGEGYAPVYIAFEDRPITLEMTPDKTGDESIDINLTLSVGAAGVAASKYAVISNV